jgi:hypothetical protein
MAGRRPKSATLKLLQGNRGKRQLREDEPHAPAGWPEKPELGAVASAEWDRLARLLEAELRLTTSDGPNLTNAAKAWAGATALEAKQALCGPEAIDHWIKLDARIQMRQEQYRKCVNDLCLSQGTRSRAKTANAKPTSRLTAFLRG